MTLTKLFLYIGVFALAVLLMAMATRRTRNILVNFVQFYVGGLFIFSGIVKGIDPIGTAIKMEEYFEVFVEYVPALTGFWHFMAGHALAVGIFMIVLELFLGFTLLFGKYKRLTVWLLLLIIAFFTFLTGFSHFTGKVTDCGCFGDFMKISPYQSFLKDIFLTALILIVFFGRGKLAELLPPTARSGVVWVLTAISIWFCFRNVYNLPVVDFRAYKTGVNIPQCMELPPDAKPYKYEIVYTYRNKESGEVKEFVNTWPEDFSAWEYVDRKDKLIQKGDDPKCKDFVIYDADGNDITADFLAKTQPMVVITSFDVARANRKGFERLARVAAQAEADGYLVAGLTGSALTDAEALRHDLGLAAEFHNLDAVPIKTMNRSNPGIVVLQEGTVLGKFHHRKAKSWEKLKGRLIDG